MPQSYTGCQNEIVVVSLSPGTIRIVGRQGIDFELEVKDLGLQGLCQLEGFQDSHRRALVYLVVLETDFENAY